MIRAVFFDLYGTLLVYGNMGKAFRAWHGTLASAATALGRKTTLKEMSKKCKAFFDIPVQGLNGFSPYEERLRILFRTFDIEVSDVWLHKFSGSSMDSWQREIKLHPEAIKLLKALQAQKIHTGIISNFDHAPHVRRVLKSTGLNKVIQTVVLSSEEHVRKPDPKIFEIAAQKAGVAPSEILFVGDDPKHDQEGAQNAGLHGFLYKNGTPLMPILEEIKKH